MRWASESITDKLAQSFSHAVGRHVELKRAKFSVLADSTLSQEALCDFRHGSKTSGEPTADAWLVDFLLTQAADTFLLIADWTAKRGAKFLQTRAMPAVFHDDEVYYVVPNSAPAEVPNWRRIVSNTVPLFHGFVIQGAPMPEIGSQIDAIAIERLAAHVKGIVFGVYDGESYMVAELP